MCIDVLRVFFRQLIRDESDRVGRFTLNCSINNSTQPLLEVVLLDVRTNFFLGSWHVQSCRRGTQKGSNCIQIVYPTDCTQEQSIVANGCIQEQTADDTGADAAAAATTTGDEA